MFTMIRVVSTQLRPPFALRDMFAWRVSSRHTPPPMPLVVVSVIYPTYAGLGGAWYKTTWYIGVGLLIGGVGWVVGRGSVGRGSGRWYWVGCLI